MSLPSAYANYQNSKAQTATPAQLTLMLYDGAIKFCNIAIIAIEDKNFEKANINIQKVEKIIDEFRATLNYKYPVAKDFDNVYQYINKALLDANFRKDKERLEEVLEHLRTMRETWLEVMRRAKTQ